MSKTSNLNIRLDKATHQQLKDLAAQLGLPASSLVTASIRQMIRNRSVTFSTELQPTPYLQNLIKEAEADYAAGRTYGPFTTAEEMIAALEAPEE